MGRLVVLLLAVCLLSCSGSLPGAPAGAAAQVAAGSGRPEPVRLWQDASIFSLVGGLIDSARRRVLVEVYELGRPALVASLGMRRSVGVDVRVITDPTVLANRASVLSLGRLRVAERLYPVDDGRRQIDHVKLLIADSEAVVGGMNWGAHSDRNHDYVLETRVPQEIDRLVRIFEQDWALAGGHPAPLALMRSEVAQTAPGDEIRTMLESAMTGARQRVLVEMFTLTDPAVITELAEAHRRGVVVRVLLDPHQPYNRRAYDLLKSSGVEVRWFPIPRGSLLHAKIGLFDSVLMLGSANWTFSGLGVNHELDIQTQDPDAVAAYKARFNLDWARSAGWLGQP